MASAENEIQEFVKSDPDYDAWMNQLALECQCCPLCWDVPCDGCMAGGICDAMCICEEKYDYDECQLID